MKFERISYLVKHLALSATLLVNTLFGGGINTKVSAHEIQKDYDSTATTWQKLLD